VHATGSSSRNRYPTYSRGVSRSSSRKNGILERPLAFLRALLALIKSAYFAPMPGRSLFSSSETGQKRLGRLKASSAERRDKSRPIQLNRRGLIVIYEPRYKVLSNATFTVAYTLVKSLPAVSRKGANRSWNDKTLAARSPKLTDHRSSVTFAKSRRYENPPCTGESARAFTDAITPDREIVVVQ